MTPRHPSSRRRARSLVGALAAIVVAVGTLSLGAGLTEPAHAASIGTSDTAMPIPQSQYQIVGYDSQSPPYPAPPSLDGTAAAAIDGDYSTEWSSAYNSGNPAPMPHWLTIDVGGDYTLTGLQYSVKVQSNGPIKDYAVYVTDSASVAKVASSPGWGAPVATGSFQQPTSNTEVQTVEFDKPVRGRYVRFVALSAINGSANASASEIGLLAKPSPGTPLYNVTVGSLGTWSNPDDTPASPFIDKNGTFYYEEADALYGATQPRQWTFYTGSDMDDATPATAINSAVDPADPANKNSDTTVRCNNSPTGLTATYAPAGSGYSQRNYCDLTQVWVDPDTGDWYGLVHNEFTPQPFGDGLHYDAIDYAVSTDEGLTWTIEGHAITSPYSTTRDDTTAFPEETYDYGDGDPRLYVDTASGYFYLYYGSRIVDKQGGWTAFYEHVARAPIVDKMAAGSWRKWYDGSWSQPGLGGKESNMVPISSTNSTGYTPPAEEYDPKTPGTATQQIAAGEMPPTSPLFVMDITYDAYLGLYIGEPQNPDQSGNASQQYYATTSLATQKWFPLGDTGSYATASWYRWFLDSANATSSSIVGKTFRSYCSFGCSSGSSGEYANVTIDSSSPSAPIDTNAEYRIANGDGQVLSEVRGRTSTMSGLSRDSLASAWKFTANGDGSYTVTNVASGGLLGVDSTSSQGRAWGAVPVVTARNGAPTVGQEWFLLPDTSASSGASTGTFRLVNRYSGLVLGMSGGSRPVVETTPARSWTDTAGSSADGLRTAAEQTLTLRPVGPSPVH